MADLVADLMEQLAPAEGAEHFEMLDRVQTTVARAAVFAPCLTDPDFPYSTAARGVLLEVVRRRAQLSKSGLLPGVSTTKARGDRSVSVDAGSVPLVLFQPAEISELQALCLTASSSTTVSGQPVWSFPEPLKWPC